MKPVLGQRVITLNPMRDESEEGCHEIIGTVIFTEEGNSCLVEFDEYMEGHSGRGKGKNDHCWWFSTWEFENDWLRPYEENIYKVDLL